MYLLDTGVVLGFQKAGHLDALTDASARVPVALVEEVYDEIVSPRNGKYAQEAAQAKASIDGSAIRRVAIMLGTPASETMAEIRLEKKSSLADLGEAASIAFALHEAAYTFVTNDRAACFRGVRELCGRVLSFHPFLRISVEGGGLGVERADEIAAAVRRLADWHATPPTWWGKWLTSTRLRGVAANAEHP